MKDSINYSINYTYNIPWLQIEPNARFVSMPCNQASSFPSEAPNGRTLGWPEGFSSLIEGKWSKYGNRKIIQNTSTLWQPMNINKYKILRKSWKGGPYSTSSTCMEVLFFSPHYRPFTWKQLIESSFIKHYISDFNHFCGLENGLHVHGTQQSNFFYSSDTTYLTQQGSIPENK